MNAGGKLGANFFQAGVDFGLRRLGGLDVLLAHLLLDEIAADELFEGALRGKDA
jgi:hypothetical protein